MDSHAPGKSDAYVYESNDRGKSYLFKKVMFYIHIVDVRDS